MYWHIENGGIYNYNKRKENIKFLSKTLLKTQYLSVKLY